MTLPSQDSSLNLPRWLLLTALGALARYALALQRLWRGESHQVTNPLGEPLDVRIMPRPVQADVPLSMFVFPAVPDTPLPAEFAFAAVPTDPVVLEPAVIDAGRDAWIEQWTGIVLR